MSQFFPSGGQSIRVSASASILPMNIQDWFPLGWTSWTLSVLLTDPWKCLSSPHWCCGPSSVLWHCGRCSPLSLPPGSVLPSQPCATVPTHESLTLAIFGLFLSLSLEHSFFSFNWLLPIRFQQCSIIFWPLSFTQPGPSPLHPLAAMQLRRTACTWYCPPPSPSAPLHPFPRGPISPLKVTVDLQGHWGSLLFHSMGFFSLILLDFSVTPFFFKSFSLVIISILISHSPGFLLPLWPPLLVSWNTGIPQDLFPGPFPLSFWFLTRWSQPCSWLGFLLPNIHPPQRVSSRPAEPLHGDSTKVPHTPLHKSELTT